MLWLVGWDAGGMDVCDVLLREDETMWWLLVEGAESNAREELLPGIPTSFLQARVEELGRRHELVRPFCMLYLCSQKTSA
jgi:hypothetical protein